MERQEAECLGVAASREAPGGLAVDVPLDRVRVKPQSFHGIPAPISLRPASLCIIA